MKKPILAVATLLFCSLSGGAQDYPLPFGLLHRDELRSQLFNSPTPHSTLTIPAASELRVQLLSGIHSQVSRVGDPVTALVLQPVYVNGRVALPVGSLLDGRITRVRPAGHVHRSAELAFRFEQITLPDGQAESISAVLSALDTNRFSRPRLDPEGYLKGARFFASKGMAAGLLGLSAGAIPTARLFASPALHALLPVGGAAFFGYELLWPRGNDVHVLPDTLCSIRLNYPLTVRAIG